MEAVTLSWELVQGLSTNAHDFWLALKGFISMAFHHKLLELTDCQAPSLIATLKQVIHIRLVDLETKEYGDLHMVCMYSCGVVRLFLDCH